MSHQSDLIEKDIEQYLKQHENKDMLRFLTCGNVDDGKSTLIGRLLHDSKLIYEDHLDAIRKDSKKAGTQGDDIDLALLVDGLQAEREQGITIDVAYRYFSTENRKFIIADTPGHEQYTRNMATGASTCDLAIILIDARYGVQTQTRRHTYIAALLGIRNIMVAINKMDLKEYDKQVFEKIRQDYLQFSAALGNRQPANIRFVPISALRGDNVVHASEHMPWYTGPTLMQLLDSVGVERDTRADHFRFPVQYVNRPNLDFRGFSGTVAAGSVRVGDAIKVVSSGKTSRVGSIVTYDGNLPEAFEGQAVTLTLEDEIDISRGDMLVHPGAEPHFSKRLEATLVWMNEAPLVVNKLYDIKLGTRLVPGRVRKILHGVDVNELTPYSADQLELNAIGRVIVELDSAAAFDAYADSRHTGSFIVIDRLSNSTVGAGMVEGFADTEDDSEPVTGAERAARFGQRPLSLRIVSELLPFARQIERRLFQEGITALVLETDVDTPELRMLLQQAGVVVLGSREAADGELAETTLAALVDKVVEQTRL